MSKLESLQRQWPTVTAVVPSRGRPDLLARALRSIVDQRYEGEIECLVVFDGDEEALPEIEARPGRELRTVRNSRTPGAAGARNTGALVATGELLAFCDDDDEWLPEKVRCQVEALRTNSDASAVSCGILVRYRDRTVTRLPATETVTFRDLLRSRRAEIHTSTLLVRRDDFTGRIGLMDEAIPGSYAEDYEWLLRASRERPVVAVRAPLARVYWHEGSWFADRWETLARALRYLLEKYPEFELEPSGRARLYGQIAFAYAATGRRPESRAWAKRCLRLDWRQPRAYLALLASAGVVRPPAVVAVLHMFGRGI